MSTIIIASRSSYLGLGGIVMSAFIIAFIIFALAGLGIRHYIKGKGSCGDCDCNCPVKDEMHKTAK